MQKKYKKFQIKKAFSLVELSIVILITSILITGALVVSKTSKNNDKIQITKERMDIVYDALTAFVAQNRRLPCPALPTLARGSAGYGVEVSSGGTNIVELCNGSGDSLTSSEITALAYGMVPVVTLGLDPEMGEDGFGTKFSYISDKRFSHATIGLAGSGFEITQSMPNETQDDTAPMGGLAIQTSVPINSTSSTYTNILPNQNAIFALISHGPNKFGGYNASGTSSNAESSQVDERNNGGNWECDDGTDTNNVPTGITPTNSSCVAGVRNYDRGFVSSSSDSDFDDIVLFKTKTQLVKDAGLEFIMCNGSEATAFSGATYNWTNLNATYGCTLSSVANATLCVRKTCGKYGIWSSIIMTPGVAQCGSTCDSANTYGYVKSSDVSPHVNAGGLVLDGSYWNHAPVTNGGISYGNGTFTVNSAGLYIITASASISSSTTGVRGLHIRLNNADTWSYININGGNSIDRAGMSASAIIPMSAGDFVSVFVYSNQATTMSGPIVSNFAIAKIQ